MRTEKNNTAAKYRGISNSAAAHRMKKAEQKQRRLRKRLFIVFILTLIATVGVAVIAYLHTNVYQDEDEFRKYAEDQFKEHDLFKVEGKTERIYEYGSPISYAADYNVTNNKAVEAYRQKKIQDIIDDYKQTKQEEEKIRAEKNKSDKHYEPPEEALIVSSAIYNSTNGVMSIAIQSSDNQEDKRDMVNVSSSVNTYLLSEKTGNPIVAEQIFMPDYRKVCSEYFTKYFKETYDEEELQENWQNYTSENAANFNKFIISENTVTFFFEEGTILDKSKGVIAEKITKNQMGETIRSKIIDRYIDPNKPMVAITFDDGPGGSAEDRILDCLKENGAVATFFYLGNRVGKNPKQITRAQSIGCEIGNHTWSHPQLTKITPEAAKEQMTKTNEAIKNACGSYPTVFRPSYGDTNSTVNSLVGMPVIMWSVDTLDWKTRDAQKTFASVTGTSKLNGKIILMHSLYTSTAEATELIVPWLIENGYQTVTVSELIKYKHGEIAQNGKVYR